MNEDRSTSPWLYIGLGCLVAVVLLVGTIVGLGWFGMRQAQRFAEEIRDPEARASKVQEVLGYREPPPGYYPAVSFSVPMLMRVAILTDEPPGESGEPELGSATFVLMEIRDFGNDREEVRAYLEGHGERPGMFDRTNISVGAQRELGSPRAEPLARGSFQEGEIGYLWSSHQVDLHTRQGRARGIETLVLVDCPRADRRVRLATWSMPMPSPDDPGAEVSAPPEPPGEGIEATGLAGTPGDESALRAFLVHLAPCPGA